MAIQLANPNNEIFTKLSFISFLQAMKDEIRYWDEFQCLATERENKQKELLISAIKRLVEVDSIINDVSIQLKKIMGAPKPLQGSDTEEYTKLKLKLSNVGFQRNRVEVTVNVTLFKIFSNIQALKEKVNLEKQRSALENSIDVIANLPNILFNLQEEARKFIGSCHLISSFEFM